MTATSKPAVIIGAGPYGLSLAAHLQGRGVPVRIFGDVMSSWRDRMPAGMCLKSTPSASTLSAPGSGRTLSAFQNDTGLPRLREHEVLPAEQFIAYGEWFAKLLSPGVEDTMVTGVEQAGSGFRVTLATGERIDAGSVVVASGLAGFARLPRELRSAMPDGPGPDRLVSHSSQHHDLSGYAGRRVAVIGAGQSALENAALLHEAGAEVELVSRRAVKFGAAAIPEDELARRLLPTPNTPLGPDWKLYPFAFAAGSFRYLPAETRRYLVRRVLGPFGAWWLKDRTVGQFPMHEGWAVRGAQRDGEGAVLQLAGPGGRPRELRADHIMAATGYRPQVRSIGFLSPDLRDRLATPDGPPRLSARFESDVPGLYVVSLAAAQTFGPLMRFVCGTEFASPRVSAAIAGRHDTLAPARPATQLAPSRAPATMRDRVA
jgi:cation diffusion facilitator CzcD-associated flavoprotein CzcO